MSEDIFRNEPIAREHARRVAELGKGDPYLSKVTIGLHEVMQAHFLLVDFFYEIGEGIGGAGPKSLDLLHSALGRQFTEFGGKPKWNDRILVCASLMYGLIKNHPFHDANKRTAFLCAILHLQKIGRTPVVAHEEFEDFIVNISNDSLSVYPDYNASSSDPDKDILFIAKFLKKGSRQIDLRTKQITYNELNRIISPRGLWLENPNRNRIDLFRNVDTPDGSVQPKRIAHIGFHGWSREVSRKDIDIVRDASKLDARHGYDSQAFFNGLEDPLTLIKKYKDPLERLAFR